MHDKWFDNYNNDVYDDAESGGKKHPQQFINSFDNVAVLQNLFRFFKQD